MAIENASNVVLSITTAQGLEAMAHATSCSLTVNRDLRDSTVKSSAGWQENLAGLKSWEMSGDAFVDISSPTGADVESLYNVMTGSSPLVTCTFGVQGMTYTGTAIITSLSIDAGVEENATYSISLTGSGSLAQS